MNEDIKFSRFIGFTTLLMCLIVVILALMAAIAQNENATNIIYVDDGNGVKLDIPKSNVVTEHVNIKKDIKAGEHTLTIDVRVPKINLNKAAAEIINEKIYNEYQELYSYALSITNDEYITLDYSYDYLNDDTILEIIISKKSVVDKKETSQNITYKYDIVNNTYTVE